MEDVSDPSHAVEETKEYYRQRAHSYSDWSRRTGENEGLPEPDESWFAEARTLLEALDASGLSGDVLEIASGTGVWTEALVRRAASVTALDSSQEMIERCSRRLKGNSKIKFVLADFYSWTPDTAYDAVTFSFWISHVPSARLDEFASKVARCLKPGGMVFFVDQQEGARANEILASPDGEIARRTLKDGREFRVVKHFYSPDEISDSFRRSGIETRVSRTPVHFYYVSGRKTP